MRYYMKVCDFKGKEGRFMIQHIVMFRFRETAQGRTKAENLEEAKRRMLALK